MHELIDKIIKIIGNYRIEDAGFFFRPIDNNRVQNWINQFDEGDREFILNEFLHLLPASYLSKENTQRIFTNKMEVFRKDFGYATVQDFLDESIFLDCQQPLKSQKDMLSMMNEILRDQYGYSLEACGTGNIKYWIYLDDVLASGGTFRHDIEREIEAYGTNLFRDSSITIIASFVILHNWGSKNVSYVLEQKFKFPLIKRIKYYRVGEIENIPRINSYNASPAFQIVYPKRSEQGEAFLDFIENAFDRNYNMSNSEFAFRPANHPKTEKYYSSPENRDRYETILLNKGIEIIARIDELHVQSIRPLGFTPPGYKILGTGTHFFTWRNISNTCPLVFWWGSNGWHPLFEVKNRGTH